MVINIVNNDKAVMPGEVFTEDVENVEDVNVLDSVADGSEDVEGVKIILTSTSSDADKPCWLLTLHLK